jgi:hypothetical protein
VAVDAFDVGLGEAVVEQPGGVGGLGGVLGQVGGDGARHRPVAADGVHVELGAPAGVPADPGGGGVGHSGRGDGPVHGGGESIGVERSGRDPSRAIGIVEADDGMKVDHAAALVLDDLGEADTCVFVESGGGDAGVGGEGPSQGDGGAPPQLPGQRVPHDGGGVVETFGTDRLADIGVVVTVDEVTRPPPPVGADPGGPGAAGARLPAGAAGRVDGAEAGGGQGDKHGGMRGDRIGDAFAAAQAGGDQLEGVGAIGGRAGGAPGRPALPARLEQRPVGQVGAGEGTDQFAVVGPVAAAGADETDGMPAPARGRRPGGPGVESIGVGRPGEDLA